MKVSIVRIVLRVAVVFLSFGITARANIMEMKDGRVVEGRFMGGNRLNVRFLVNGQR